MSAKKKSRVRPKMRRPAYPRKTVRPRAGLPAPHINTAEVQGLFNPFGGGGLGGAAGSVDGAASSGGLGAFFSRIGGLDGIISTMSKVQKVFTIMKQFGPIFKLIGGLGGLGFGGGAKASTASLPSGRSGVRRRPQAKRPGTPKPWKQPGARMSSRPVTRKSAKQ